MKHKRLGFVLLLTLPFCLAYAQPRSATEAITEADLKAHVEFLASPELAGRDTPSLGSRIAERYISTHFEEYGLKAFPDIPDYYQNVPLIVCRTDYEHSRMIVEKDSESLQFTPNKEIFFFPRGGENADITAPVLLCGYGIRAPEFDYDDFSGADPAGKLLLIFNREPQENDSSSAFNGAKPTKYSNPTVKVTLAKELGALGLLIIQPPNNGLPPIEETLERYRRNMNEPIVQLAEDREAFPVFYLSENAAKLLLGDDFDLSAYQRKIDTSYKGDPRLLKNAKVTLRIRFRDVTETSTFNIVGFYPGESDEAVLVLAHHDHIGETDGKIYFGADDNASGCAGLLGIAKAFSVWAEKPRRSVIFLSTAAEEKGTLGALYFTKHLPVPAENIITAVNMDEIGRNGSSQLRAMQDPSIPGEKDLLMFFYSGQSPVLAQIAEEENKTERLNLVIEPVLHFHGSSDHVHFHDLQIPSVFLFSGFHSDYHSPGDTPDKILYPKLTRVARLAFALVYDIAQRKDRPVFDTNIIQVEGTGRKYGN